MSFASRVDDFDVRGVPVEPPKTDPPLIVDADPAPSCYPQGASRGGHTKRRHESSAGNALRERNPAPPREGHGPMVAQSLSMIVNH